MPVFSEKSNTLLASCHPDLQILVKEVINYFDCSVICGHRNQQDQDAAFSSGKSQKKWPEGNHNAMPSNAVDVVPCPVDWSPKGADRMRYFAGFVMGIALKLYEEGKMKHRIRWGGDWNSNTILTDQQLIDLPHFEIIP